MSLELKIQVETILARIHLCHQNIMEYEDSVEGNSDGGNKEIGTVECCVLCSCCCLFAAVAVAVVIVIVVLLVMLLLLLLLLLVMLLLVILLVTMLDLFVPTGDRSKLQELVNNYESIRKDINTVADTWEHGQKLLFRLLEMPLVTSTTGTPTQRNSSSSNSNNNNDDDANIIALPLFTDTTNLDVDDLSFEAYTGPDPSKMKRRGGEGDEDDVEDDSSYDIVSSGPRFIRLPGACSGVCPKCIIV